MAKLRFSAHAAYIVELMLNEEFPDLDYEWGEKFILTIYGSRAEVQRAVARLNG